MIRLRLVLSDISCYLFSYLINNQKCWNSTLKLTPIISSVHVEYVLEKLLTNKLLTIVLIFFANRNMNSTSVLLPYHIGVRPEASVLLWAQCTTRVLCQYQFIDIMSNACLYNEMCGEYAEEAMHIKHSVNVSHNTQTC